MASKPRPATSAAKRRSAYHHGDLRRALIDACIVDIDRRGPSAVSLRGLAREIGVTHTAPLHHFPTRRELFAAVAAEGFRRLHATRRAALVDGEPPRARLIAALTASVDFAVAHPGLFHLMFGAEITDKREFAELVDAASRSYAVLEDCVADYLGLAPEAAVASASARAATLTAWTACHGLASILVDRQMTPREVPWRDPRRVCGEVFGRVVDGLKAGDSAVAQPAAAPAARAARSAST
jgi:AcrR family transcriptional regulator